MSDYDPTDLPAQEQVIEKDATAKRDSRDTEESDLKWLLGSKRGRRIVWRILERAGVYRSSFSTNAMTMAFAEGGRNEGLKMVAMIHATCPEMYFKMVEESNEQRHTDG